MYLVVSRWEALPGREADAARVGRQLGEVLRQQPGVTLVEILEKDGKHTAVHGYRDEAAYKAVVQNPDGAFCRAMEAQRFEDMARWLGSERGESLMGNAGSAA